jgi:FKBP-type peptidyl-prolyl cis-trans isomerase
MLKIPIGMLALAALAATVAGYPVPKDRIDPRNRGPIMTTTPSGLQYEDSVVGTGAEAVAGKSVDVHYTGTLVDGSKFDSSVGRKPFTFKLGVGMVIKGWDEGVAGMKVGGKRKLVIPANLGYGTRGAGSAIPPNAVLHFDVELLKVS